MSQSVTAFGQQTPMMDQLLQSLLGRGANQVQQSQAVSVEPVTQQAQPTGSTPVPQLIPQSNFHLAPELLQQMHAAQQASPVIQQQAPVAAPQTAAITVATQATPIQNGQLINFLKHTASEMNKLRRDMSDLNLSQLTDKIMYTVNDALRALGQTPWGLLVTPAEEQQNAIAQMQQAQVAQTQTLTPAPQPVAAAPMFDRPNAVQQLAA